MVISQEQAKVMTQQLDARPAMEQASQQAQPFQTGAGYFSRADGLLAKKEPESIPDKLADLRRRLSEANNSLSKHVSTQTCYGESIEEEAETSMGKIHQEIDRLRVEVNRLVENAFFLDAHILGEDRHKEGGQP